MLGKPETPASPKQLRLNFENFFSRHFASRRVTAASPSRTQKFAFPLCASRCRALGLGAHDPVHRSHMQDRFAWRTACSRNLRQPVDRAYSCNPLGQHCSQKAESVRFPSLLLSSSCISDLSTGHARWTPSRLFPCLEPAKVANQPASRSTAIWTQSMPATPLSVSVLLHLSEPLDSSLPGRPKTPSATP